MKQVSLKLSPKRYQYGGADPTARGSLIQRIYQNEFWTIEYEG